jgi:hypothetical protein
METISWIIIAILLGIIIFCGVFIYYLTSISSVFSEAIYSVINKRLKN